MSNCGRTKWSDSKESRRSADSSFKNGLSNPNSGAAKRVAAEEHEDPLEKRQKQESQERGTKRETDEWEEMAKRIKQSAERRVKESNALGVQEDQAEC